VLEVSKLAARGLAARLSALAASSPATVGDHLIEMNGALTGLITTQGHRDELELRRGFKEDIWDVRLPPPPPIVPPRRRGARTRALRRGDAAAARRARRPPRCAGWRVRASVLAIACFSRS
jgi:N-methylhydantoinase A/oxoprolinase/acetone carboxylase beta subunit